MYSITQYNITASAIQKRVYSVSISYVYMYVLSVNDRICSKWYDDSVLKDNNVKM